MLRRHYVGGLALGGLIVAGCSDPVLTGLDPPYGRPHQLVSVAGSNLDGASVVWDAGLPGEKVLPGGFQAATMFTVPMGAAAGTHPVALRQGWFRSAALPFQVTSAAGLVGFGRPRIDAVMLAAAGSTAVGTVVPILYVQGGNIDVGATVTLGDSAGTTSLTEILPTVAHKALRNDLFGIDPAELGRPIYHYTALLAPAGVRADGETLTIRVINLDGEKSQPFEYALPASFGLMDSDGDGLRDHWETNGYPPPAGTIGGGGTSTPTPTPVDLRARGADPHRRDILLELDRLSGTVGPAPAVLELSRAMFVNAPILNLVDLPGINLDIDASSTPIPWNTGAPIGMIDLIVTRFDNFDPNLKKISHYGLWAAAHEAGWSGVSDGGASPGSTFAVTIESLPDLTLRSAAATLVHELGHDLGQAHASSHELDHSCRANNSCVPTCSVALPNPPPACSAGCARTCNTGCSGPCLSSHAPNYWSVMNYAWQRRQWYPSQWRCRHPTCTPAFYGDAAGAEVEGVLSPTAAASAFIDYSEGMARELEEDHLDETRGVCGVAVDFNCDGDTVDTDVAQDLDFNRCCGQLLHDFANWPALRFEGPGLASW